MRAHGFSAVEDRRRRRAAGSPHRRRPARLRPGRPRAGRSDCRAEWRPAGRCASSGCSIAPATSSSRAASRAAGCSIWPSGRTPASCWRRSAARPATAAEALTTMAGHAVSRPIIVDVTSEETGDLLRTAIGHGFNVVLANKKPLAGVVGSLRGAAGHVGERRAARCKYEATVGAGPADHRHLPQAGRDRRPRAAHRRLRQRHADVHHVGDLRGAALLGRRARGGREGLRRAGRARRSVGHGRGAQGR